MKQEEYEEELQEMKDLYMETLENYHRVSEQLRQEREWNVQNTTTIRALNETIERYEKMFDKVSFQVIDGNRY